MTSGTFSTTLVAAWMRLRKTSWSEVDSASSSLTEIMMDRDRFSEDGVRLGGLYRWNNSLLEVIDKEDDTSEHLLLLNIDLLGGLRDVR